MVLYVYVELTSPQILPTQALTLLEDCSYVCWFMITSKESENSDCRVLEHAESMAICGVLGVQFVVKE
jgi:hypothetical protein